MVCDGVFGVGIGVWGEVLVGDFLEEGLDVEGFGADEGPDGFSEPGDADDSQEECGGECG